MAFKLIRKLSLATLEKDLSGVWLEEGRSVRQWGRKDPRGVISAGWRGPGEDEVSVGTTVVGII